MKFNFKSMGEKILQSVIKKLTSGDSASKKMVDGIIQDITNNFKSMNADRVFVFIGFEKGKMRDYAERANYGAFEIDRNKLLQISGIPDGFITFERFSSLFSSDDKSMFGVCLYMDGDSLIMSIYSLTFEVEFNDDKSILNSELIQEKALSAFINDAIRSMSENEGEVSESLGEGLANIMDDIAND